MVIFIHVHTTFLKHSFHSYISAIVKYILVMCSCSTKWPASLVMETEAEEEVVGAARGRGRGDR